MTWSMIIDHPHFHFNSSTSLIIFFWMMVKWWKIKWPEKVYKLLWLPAGATCIAILQIALYCHDIELVYDDTYHHQEEISPPTAFKFKVRRLVETSKLPNQMISLILIFGCLCRSSYFQIQVTEKYSTSLVPTHA